MNELIVFARNLKTLRYILNMSQSELAEKAKVSRSNISNYESAKNEPTLQALINLSKTFNVSIDLIISVDLSEMYKQGDVEIVELNNKVKKNVDDKFANELKYVKNEYEKEKDILTKYINEDIPNKVDLINEMLKKLGK